MTKHWKWVTVPMALSQLALAGCAKDGLPREPEAPASAAPSAGANEAKASANPPAKAPPEGATGAAIDPSRTDYLTFAHGALPVAMTIDGAPVDRDLAVPIIDGDPTPFSLVRKGGNASVVEIVYELPAATTFDRFTVPNVLEVPSKFTSFLREVEVLGSSAGPDAGFSPLASATLVTHEKKGQSTDLALVRKAPVRWITLRLRGAIDVENAPSTLQFSEIVGLGQQDVAPMASHFTGVWKGKGVIVELKQKGLTVTGCYDMDGGALSGTVEGNLLKAVGVGGGDSVPSAFILSVDEGGALRGLRSTNGAPFRAYGGPKAPAGEKTKCSEAPPRALGCGSVIHAIGFDFDAAALRPESSPVLAELASGLKAEGAASIVVEGHTSSEGSRAHNEDLSKRRAQAVVAELEKRGVDPKKLSAVGVGPNRPIAKNDDETGRVLNRRVEISCK